MQTAIFSSLARRFNASNLSSLKQAMNNVQTTNSQTANVQMKHMLTPHDVQLTHRCHIASTAALNKLITIKDDDDFLSKVMNSDIPVIVNFHAEWCEPCHILTPKMKELIEPKDNIDLAIVDVENHANLVHTFEVKAVPAVLAVKNGLVVDKFIGLVDANMIEELINKLDNKKS